MTINTLPNIVRNNRRGATAVNTNAISQPTSTLDQLVEDRGSIPEHNPRLNYTSPSRKGQMVKTLAAAGLGLAAGAAMGTLSGVLGAVGGALAGLAPGSLLGGTIAASLVHGNHGESGAAFMGGGVIGAVAGSIGLATVGAFGGTAAIVAMSLAGAVSLGLATYLKNN